MTSYTFSIDFPRWKVLPYDSFRSKVACFAYEKEHVTWPTWPFWALQMVTRASPKFKFAHFFLIIIIIIRCSGMFRDVPCSWFYRRPFSPAGKKASISSFVRFWENKGIMLRTLRGRQKYQVTNVRVGSWEQKRQATPGALCSFQISSFIYLYHNDLLPLSFQQIFQIDSQIWNYSTRISKSYRFQN